MIQEFQNQLTKIEKLLVSINQKDAEYMDIDEASKFLRLKKSTIYQFVFKRQIPFYKNTKKLLFKKADLIEWVEKDRIFTVEELKQIMNNPINDKGK